MEEENKKLRTLIKKIHEDLKLRAEVEVGGYRVLNVSHGTLLEMEEVLKE